MKKNVFLTGAVYLFNVIIKIVIKTGRNHVVNVNLFSKESNFASIALNLILISSMSEFLNSFNRFVSISSEIQVFDFLMKYFCGVSIKQLPDNPVFFPPAAGKTPDLSMSYENRKDNRNILIDRLPEYFN